MTGTAEPVPLEEIDRSVTALTVRGNELLANSPADFLRLDPSIDLRERAPGLVQSDVSIRGGSFGQALILLNGQRLNDAQSAHHNLDLPVPLESISRIEILRGSGSSLYGSDASAGVVNIITRPPEGSEFRLRTGIGNFGTNQQRGSLAASVGRLSEQIVFSRDFSSGFRPDRDYRNLTFASTTHFEGTDVVLGYADKPFGADQFYGNYNSWEDTKTWFASIRQAIGRDTEASVAFRRHSDLFVLYRDRPEVFTNHHEDETWQAAIRRRQQIGANTTVHYGVEGFHDSIVSNNLGSHSRSRGAAYAGVEFRALRRFSFSASAREEHQLSPTVAAGVWLSPKWKLRASASRSFRIPSYTDLYYHDPANLGSPDLRPERAWSYEAGAEWNPGGKLRGEVTVFQRREKDGIDYIRRSPADIWRAANIQDLRFTGVEASVKWQRFDFRYTGLDGVQNAIPGIFSKYVFNYPTHSGLVAWEGALPHGLLLRTRVGVLDRRARDPYAVWDVYTAYSRGRVHPFLQLTNLSDTRYEEVLGVAVPGRAVLGGIEIVVFNR